MGLSLRWRCLNDPCYPQGHVTQIQSRETVLSPLQTPFENHKWIYLLFKINGEILYTGSFISFSFCVLFTCFWLRILRCTLQLVNFLTHNTLSKKALFYFLSSDILRQEIETATKERIKGSSTLPNLGLGHFTMVWWRANQNLLLIIWYCKEF